MKTKLISGLAIAVLMSAVLGCGSDSEGAKSDKAVRLPFVSYAVLPPSSQSSVPGGKKPQMDLRDGQIWATAANEAGQSLVWVSTTLRIDGGAPVGGGRVLCSTRAGEPGTTIAKSVGKLPALYPRSSEVGIYDQAIPRPLLMRFPTDGSDLAIVSSAHAPARFSTVKDVKVTWPASDLDTAVLRYELPATTQQQAIELPFFMLWRAKTPSTFKVTCTLTMPAGKTTVATEGSLPSASQPVATASQGRPENA
jgi:hypothetical protein